MHYSNCVTQSHPNQSITTACTKQDSDDCSSLHGVFNLHACIHVNV